MKTIITFSELQSFLKSKTQREVTLTALDEKTIKAETKVSVKVPIIGRIEKIVGVNVSVERIGGQDLHLKYDATGTGTDLIITGALIFLASSSAKKIVEKMPNNGMLVHLKEVKELEMLELTGISFGNGDVVIDGKLRE